MSDIEGVVLCRDSIYDDWSFRHCVATGTYINSPHCGAVREYMITDDALIDPLGDMHFPPIGYAVDDIDDGGIGRVVIAM